MDYISDIVTTKAGIEWNGITEHFQEKDYKFYSECQCSKTFYLYVVRYLPRNAPEDVVVEVPGLVEVAGVEGDAILLAPPLSLVQVVPVGLREKLIF